MNHTFEDFVLTYDNFFTSEECQSMIDCFHRFEKGGFTMSRQAQGSKSHEKKDDQLYVTSLLSTQEFDLTDLEPFSLFNRRFWDVVYPLYVNQYSVISTYSHHTIRLLKLQKTEVGGGYHVWHSEDGDPQVMRRMMTFILYLNDVEQGGETEFLYYPKRIPPKKGTLILWPAGYTHAHRGNPPLTNTKYIATGWVELS